MFPFINEINENIIEKDINIIKQLIGTIQVYGFEFENKCKSLLF